MACPCTLTFVAVIVTPSALISIELPPTVNLMLFIAFIVMLPMLASIAMSLCLAVTVIPPSLTVRLSPAAFIVVVRPFLTVTDWASSTLIVSFALTVSVRLLLTVID